MSSSSATTSPVAPPAARPRPTAARTVVAPGLTAHQALAAEVRAAQADDVFAPVTVLVPSRRSALSLRRELAAGLPGGDKRGLVNVRFEVATRLVELLGAPALTGRRRLRDAVLREHVRSALTTDPAHFGKAATHPATIERVVAGYREFRLLDPSARAALGGAGHRGRALAAVYARVESALAAWYDDADLVAASGEAIRAGGPAIDELGAVVWFAPDLADPVAVALIAAFAGRAVTIELAEPPVADVCPGLSLVSASDPDEEARFAVRHTLALTESGTPLHRIAIAHPGGRYARLVHQHLERAAVPHHGPSVRELAHTPGGVTLLGLLELAATDLGRDPVMRWLASAPILDPSTGGPAPAASWDHESRRAGVIAGLGQWRSRLAQRIDELRERGGELAEARVGRVAALGAFIEGLHTVADGVRTQSWAAWSRWAATVLDTYLGRASARRRWPDEELDAFEQLHAAVVALSSLDGIAPEPDPATFADVLGMELEAPVGRVGSFGDGVYVGPIRSIAGLCVDAVIVLGAAEGLLPHRPGTDPLLGDDERHQAGLPEPGGSIDDQRRELLLALGTAGGTRTVTTPRGDLRANRAHLPSRWVLELASALVGAPVASDQLADLAGQHEGIRSIESFAAGLGAAGAPLDVADHRLAALWSSYHRPGHPPDHPVTASHPVVASRPRLAAGFRAEVARSTEGFTEFDGRLDPADAVLLPEARPLSPTSLQAYAKCPRQYLLAKVLGLRPIDRPEAITELSPLERGSLVHLILERWVRDRLDGVAGAGKLDHLLGLADTAFAEAEAHGITGRPLPWKYVQTLIRRELTTIAARDRAGEPPVGQVPLAVEFTFGRDGAEPLIIDVPGQGPIAFAGSVDRIDRAADGALVVADYKTGGAKGYNTLGDAPVKQGELLQLPIYALAARKHFGDESTPVSAWYWFITEREKYKHVGYEVTDTEVDALRHALSAVVGGIRAGQFPGRPGAFDQFRNTGEHCHWCDFDRVCPANRAEQWDRSAADPALGTYVALTRGPAVPAEGDAR